MKIIDVDNVQIKNKIYLWQYPRTRQVIPKTTRVRDNSYQRHPGIRDKS